ncbi:Eye-enriched kainate receptor [Carabus blaptoides fortunei]
MPIPRSPSKINSNDIVIFFGRHLQSNIRKDALEILKLAGNILLYEQSNLYNNYMIYHACYYCGQQSTRFKLLLNSTTNNTINPKDVQPVALRNLQGHLLHTVFIQYHPFVYCNEKKLKETIVNGVKVLACNDVGGIESNLLQTISEKLNFTFLVHTLNSSASFFDMIMHINARKADISFGGVTMSEERIPFVQFSNQYNFEGYVFLYVLTWTFEKIFAKFMEPFRAVAVWMLYIISFLVLSLLVYTIRRIKKHESNGERSFGRTLWMLLHMPFEQSVSGIGRIITINPSIFIAMSLWWWSSMIICTLFKSNLLSAMVLPPNTEPENLEQLVMAGYRFAGNLQYADIIKELLHVNDPMYKEAYEKTMYAEGACETLEKILVGGVALLDELSEIQYELRSICPVPDESILNRFRTTRKIIRFAGHSWALQIGAPYRQALDYYLSLILSGGLFIKWTRDETRHLEAYLIPKSRSIIERKAVGLSFVRLTPVLVVYSAGILVAFICLLGEIVLFLYIKKIH